MRVVSRLSANVPSAVLFLLGEIVIETAVKEVIEDGVGSVMRELASNAIGKDLVGWS